MLIKKIFQLLITVTTFLFFCYFQCSALSISAQSAVVLDARTGDIVFESNAYEKRSMASTTKIMTAILAIESGKLEQCVEVTAQMTRTEGTSIGLKVGYKMKLIDLVYGMMLESGNDAANTVALYLADSYESFSAMMNRKAAEIGMVNTNFVTPSGLDDEKHYSTAYDMALLASYCIKNPVFRSICSEKNYVAELIDPASNRLYFSNHNRLLSSVDGVFGVKTGFTKKSGRCLVSAIEKNGAVLVAVTLKAPDDWNDHRKLFSYCLDCYESASFEESFPTEIAVEGGQKTRISVLAETKRLDFAVKSGKKTGERVYFPSFVYAPIKKGDVLGRAEYFADGKSVETVCFIAGESVECVSETYVSQENIFKRLIERIKCFFN